MNNDLHYLTAVDPQRNSIGRLQYLNWGEFSGVVSISVASGQAWEIIFYQGQIVWSLDRSQPNRLWHRLLRSHVGYKYVGLDLLFEAANHDRSAKVEQNVCWQYQGAIALLRLAEIKLPELSAMLTTATQETIFDLLQYSQGEKLTSRDHVARVAYAKIGQHLTE
jgi:two-component system, chemotaxis family, response regulator PixG